MVRGMYRSRTLRRVKVKAPGGKVHIHYRQRKPQAAKCAYCLKPLAGVPRENAKVMQSLAKTKKRPQRMYGGKLCGNCLKGMLQRKARDEQ